MAKNFGSVNLGDKKRLNEIAEEAGVYLDAEEVWDEAVSYMQGNDTYTAEVRIRGLDYIEVYK